MIVYKASDVKLSWQHHHTEGEMGVPKTCGYIKEGLGKNYFYYFRFYRKFSI